MSKKRAKYEMEVAGKRYGDFPYILQFSLFLDFWKSWNVSGLKIENAWKISELKIFFWKKRGGIFLDRKWNGKSGINFLEHFLVTLLKLLRINIWEGGLTLSEITTFIWWKHLRRWRRYAIDLNGRVSVSIETFASIATSLMAWRREFSS